MGKIHVLDQNTINMIAAGEVVERPASVVKELVENSIDAGATKITVSIKNGGIDEITVTDNGQGISAEDAELAFTQHATSKITSASDLENIFTLGFRGEALASISSVSRVELDTKTEATPATKVVVENSQSGSKTSNKATTGTTISVFDLFRHIPARKKFLRTPATELSHVQEMFISLALVNLQVHFELIHNGKLLLRLPAVENFNERVFAIWNAQVAENLYESHVEIPGGKIHLYIGKPEAGRKDRKLQYLFVNKRHVSDRILSKAVIEGYTGFLPGGIYPVYFIMLELDPKVVDVNVHPRKLEVRFDNSGQIFGAVKNAVSQALTTNTKRDLMSRVSSGDRTSFSPIPDTPTFLPASGRRQQASVGKQSPA
ncbi:DNA mismatch repair endonuclease MutL, partial [Candidatus Dojkabacteria bacterium]|nr:DNA mismatch repair endonuclease MutL [Candidatus Dojkabacteria bacterium]